ncbi:CoA transferase [Acrocarpospora macrocephala]|uniref:CoA transferase n=1 Tax=Acrocarpospora macrocephala TaxID=150177 RepID=A0A5M3WJ11_9ACTN|nr:CaiB/BaiF CoA-transferase family protein [Acrocarpospora macrocephala]GES07013.1 CoA transferase [Acrocarpospora macrocephala]
MSSGPLAGIVVVSLAEQYPGPFATMVLADLGAQVTMVERPSGDPTRRHPALFRALNRNKRSIVLDLKTLRGQAALRSMLADADVLIEGFRPGVMGRLGFPPEELRRDFPDLVIASVSSYGQTGPDRELGSHDLTVQGRAGLLDGARDGVGVVPTADLVAGAFAVIGVLSGLVARQARGGSHVDVSMLDCLVAWQAVRMAGYLTGDETTGYPPREPAYGVFQCGDGGSVTLAIAGEDPQWATLCDVLELGDLGELRTGEREGRADELRTLLSRALAARDSGDVIRRLEQRGVSCGHVRRPSDVLGDPQVKARRLLLDVSSGHQSVRQPLLFDGQAITACPGAPALGEHNELYGLDPVQADR